MQQHIIYWPLLAQLALPLIILLLNAKRKSDDRKKGTMDNGNGKKGKEEKKRPGRGEDDDMDMRGDEDMEMEMDEHGGGKRGGSPKVLEPPRLAPSPLTPIARGCARFPVKPPILSHHPRYSDSIPLKPRRPFPIFRASRARGAWRSRTSMKTPRRTCSWTGPVMRAQGPGQATSTKYQSIARPRVRVEAPFSYVACRSQAIISSELQRRKGASMADLYYLS